ncbi:MAG: glutamate synthase-related protein [Candidatus Zhuqueibacterota bacterium]
MQDVTTVRYSNFLKEQSALKRVSEQRNATELLYQSEKFQSNTPVQSLPGWTELRQKLSEASVIFFPNDVQQQTYTADTGTHIVPSIFKRMLVKIKLSFVFRPGCVEDLSVFVKWAYENKIHYTIRGAGTWPFGGCVPINGDVVVDLSYLDFMHVDEREGIFTFGAGVVFPKARKFLQEREFTLKQEITNPGSGTIAGWLATGGIGLGSYKYGHVSNSVRALLVITPAGECITVDRDDANFTSYFGSEGQFGIIAGASMEVRRESYVTKPYAFSFTKFEDAVQFIHMLEKAQLKPTSVIYFSDTYIAETYKIEKRHVEERLNEALDNNDQTRLRETREDRDTIEAMKQYQHVVVIHFDENSDYQFALKSRLFGKSGELRRASHISYLQLPTDLAHIFWDHRFLPVQLKVNGPTVLVSEFVLPLAAFSNFQNTLQKVLARLLNIELKSEAHLLQDGEVLTQAMFLADTRTFRHKLYFSLIPLMTQVGYYFGARPYGIGLWNYPSLRRWRSVNREKADAMMAFKKESDPRGHINQGKFINPRRQTLAFKLFKIITPRFNQWFVATYDKRIQQKKFVLTFPFQKLVWNITRFIFPRMVPPGLKAGEHEPIERMISVCAECDSCERVCPTSDVFGLYGPATPITRRRTAQRLIAGEKISRNEALGFLACTRCDNCTDICPTNINLTQVFDLVEMNPKFNAQLNFRNGEKKEYIDRFWQIMKESPLYIEHTLAVQKEEKSHLAHGLKILYDKGFAYSELYIDPTTCIHCGMCSNENACMYAARESQPRQIPELRHINCALCNACVNFCPQNKIMERTRLYFDKLIHHAVDLEEKRYWTKQQARVHDTTTVQRSTLLTEMADRYVTEEIIMEIDKEASTGKIPVSGSGQGDRHMGIGFDAERFAHFHIVGPAQNRLHEGDPAEELAVILGKREDFCKFDRDGNLVNPVHANIKLMTPILYNAIPLESNGNVELVLIKVAEQQKSLVVIQLERLLEHHQEILKNGGYARLPQVIVPRVGSDLINLLTVHQNTSRDFITDLWRMPVFEVEYHPDIEQTISYIRGCVASSEKVRALISGYLEISEYDLIGSLSLTADIKEKVNHFLDQKVDIVHIRGLRNKDEYFVTSRAVRALHHYLMRIGRRHEVSIIASGGIRLASDTQKTIQRGAEATLIDFAALLALDPSTYRAMIENKSTTEKLLSLDVDWAVKRLLNQAESRKVQILEVLGAAGFKDLKKTVGEEGRLIDFHKLENRIQRTIFENEQLVDEYSTCNEQLIKNETIPETQVRSYSVLKTKLAPMPAPHDFYNLGEVNQVLYKRDFVWPGALIESMGRMAAGDMSMLDFNNVKKTGLLGDGFDVMRILYNKDPMDIHESELNQISTSLLLDKGLILEAPWMFGGKSIGSIGLDTWKAHVTASRELGIQFDTGEGGYPTSFFLNSKGEPLFFTENEIQLIKSYFESGSDYTIEQIQKTLAEKKITEESHPELYKKLKQFPSLKPFRFLVIVDEQDQPFVSTELKTGLFGVTKTTIQKARRVVIAYSQGAKMGIGGHILAQKVNKLVSYMRGVEGIEYTHAEKVEQLYQKLQKIASKNDHPLHELAVANLDIFNAMEDQRTATEAFKNALWQIQEYAYNLHARNAIDPIEFKNILQLCEEIIDYSYSSIISPFPFHNCYSIEDVKAFIDVVRMINPEAVIAIKVSPSIDIEFIATGLGRIARDNTDEILAARFNKTQAGSDPLSVEMAEYTRKYGMKIEIWLDGPRGGTGASPNIIKGQMGMHLEYAIPLIHYRLVKDGLRNYVKFIVSGGIRTFEDVIKAVALGADGVVWGTAPLVAIGCDRNRNCHDGCSRGIATSNLKLQQLRDVAVNTQQIINAFTMIQMQCIRAIAALGFSDIRELRGRFDKIHWLGLKERVDHRYRVRAEVIKEIEKDEQLFEQRMARATGQSNCGVAAINGTTAIPGYILDQTLQSMRNRGMDGVGIAKTLCFPDHPNEYAYRILVKGRLHRDIEFELRKSQDGKNEAMDENELRTLARERTVALRISLMRKIKSIYLDPYFDYFGQDDVTRCREPYKVNEQSAERDYREFGNANTDPGDVFRFFVRVKPAALYHFIENELLRGGKPRLLEHLFPEITPNNYRQNETFLNKAEDLFILQHSHNVTRILYVSSVLPDELEKFAGKKIGLKRISEADEEYILADVRDEDCSDYLKLLRDFMLAHPFEHHKHRYGVRNHKIAAVMSCGKNFAVWKTAGREIPWQTPDAPNNIIHVRLATGSVVEQMNSHPFAKLHTALTHNGETTNYEALKQRVEQFNLSPLASTDTEVASLKFHLTADEWEYPDWALFESFSPTTGDDLQLVDEKIRPQLEQVQRVEFTSSPDGPYQYLCLRHNPYTRVTERVDLKDPADLRPNVTAFWSDQSNGQRRVFSIIASEEQAINTMLRLLDKEGIIQGSVADLTFVNAGMISRYWYDEANRITDFRFVDRYGRAIQLENSGMHHSVRQGKPLPTQGKDTHAGWQNRYQQFFRDNLAAMTFDEFRWLLHQQSNENADNAAFARTLEIFTWLRDYLRTLNPGEKAQSSLIDITQYYIDALLDRAKESVYSNYVWCSRESALQFNTRAGEGQTLVINAGKFLPEGTDPAVSLTAFLSKAHRLGWRKFILYNTTGQRLISTAALHGGDSDDVVMDVYGSVGEYFGAFMQGGILRLHGNAQNFAAMCMHHGELYIFGNAGKVCGYASKGGKVVVLGNVVDRCWTNSVNDSRCQDLDVMILGSATKYAGESLMGGKFFFAGLHFDVKGNLCFNERPYLGTKMLGGASRGDFIFFDPENRLIHAQYVHGAEKQFTIEEWQAFKEKAKSVFRLSNIPIHEADGVESIQVGDRRYDLIPAHFKFIVPRGGLRGYESH